LDLSKNKIAVVTGASKGLGAAIAITLAMKGVHVYGIGRRIHERSGNTSWK
jgi:NADP-dependent 3-hydroxy acid dehydrogenase YdfG